MIQSYEQFIKYVYFRQQERYQDTGCRYDIKNQKSNGYPQYGPSYPSLFYPDIPQQAHYVHKRDCACKETDRAQDKRGQETWPGVIIALGYPLRPFPCEDINQGPGQRQDSP